MTRSAPRVLHVVEALGGGVASALEAYVRAVPEASHHLLAVRRDGVQTGDGIADLVEEVHTWSGGPVASLRQIARHVHAINPDIVHAHSSFAGLYVRCLPTVRARTIVYTPHCFAFERRDVSAFTRFSYQLIEAALAGRSGTVVACSPREAALAHKLRRRSRVEYVPNVADIPRAVGTRLVEERRGKHRFDGTVTVATAGRVCQQKDPAFFAAAARACHSIAPEIRWLWLGGGDSDDEAHLRAAGVHVTGWLPRAEALQRLASATAYAHTAAWEGAPISILEAAALELPIVARRIPALESMGLTPLADTPEQLAAQVAALRDPSVELAARERALALHSRHQPAEQARTLSRAYQLSATPAR